ncbi:hypothetical protein [Uliginosibacterium sp. 31-12]|uniref:hypothetical protein n=1 Tax=Uliginosibacterium sp. 31-12 TaxID=3062781 RepID=UPI0026E21729|nr:hypothetical protein [Uliginosibacterium sp. 31-12]MDO6388470.1 hypothetical protein [Uliginosibacterium sp. 31-12]
MRSREITALLVAPLASGMLQGALMGNIGAFIFAIVFAYVFSAIIGLPALAILRRNNWSALSKHLLMGSCSGVICGFVLGIFTGYSGFSIGSVLGGLLLFAAHGFVVALSYWFVAYSFANPQPTGEKALKTE